MNIHEALSQTLIYSTTPRIDLEILLAHTLNQPRSFLYAYPEHALSDHEQRTFLSFCAQRLEGKPVAYITGKKEFWSLELIIDNNVLIPRPETETLVNVALDKIHNNKAVVADLGTGSGAIALALATEHPQWKIIATDISKAALKVAYLNAKRLQLQNISFYHSNWFENLPKIEFDAIISNPPYIAHNDSHLKTKELTFEPQIALVAHNGLSALRAIIEQAKYKLKKQGMLILEHGYNQKEKVQTILKQHNYQNINTYKDLSGIDRTSIAQI